MGFKFNIGDTVKIVPKYYRGCVSTEAIKYANVTTTIVDCRYFKKPSYLLKGLEYSYFNDPDFGTIEHWWEEGLLELVTSK